MVFFLVNILITFETLSGSFFLGICGLIFANDASVDYTRRRRFAGVVSLSWLALTVWCDVCKKMFTFPLSSVLSVV